MIHKLVIDVETTGANRVYNILQQIKNIKKIERPVTLTKYSYYSHINMDSTLDVTDWENVFETAEYADSIIGIMERED